MSENGLIEKSGEYSEIELTPPDLAPQPDS